MVVHDLRVGPEEQRDRIRYLIVEVADSRHDQVGPTVLVEIARGDSVGVMPGRHRLAGFEGSIRPSQQDRCVPGAVVDDHQVHAAVAVDVRGRQGNGVGPDGEAQGRIERSVSPSVQDGNFVEPGAGKGDVLETVPVQILHDQHAWIAAGGEEPCRSERSVPVPQGDVDPGTGKVQVVRGDPGQVEHPVAVEIPAGQRAQGGRQPGIDLRLEESVSLSEEDRHGRSARVVASSIAQRDIQPAVAIEISRQRAAVEVVATPINRGRGERTVPQPRRDPAGAAGEIDS